MSASNLQTYYFFRPDRHDETGPAKLFAFDAKPHGDGLKATRGLPQRGYATIVKRPALSGIFTDPQKALDHYRAKQVEIVEHWKRTLATAERRLAELPATTSPRMAFNA